ncbi:tRNA (adenine(22)-N(1))-methyltransferase [Neobacillus niacini]|uniref:tRNA (adenine(22)-N(1))-methyltransferase n=1 Tax=Neobacillus niacini TaxID=86668 RepID=UPI00398314B6
MNTDKLSLRLETVAKYVPKNSRLADIGSDHAYLPSFLAKNGVITFGIAGEVVKGPFQSAEKNVRAQGLTSMISVRMGDGLEVIQPGEVDCVTIAGMGGTLIANILETGKEKLSSVKRLVLQPNINAIAIRNWLVDHEWELITEEIIEEDNKIYEIVVAERGDPLKPYRNLNIETGLLVGPFLLERKENVFKKKWSFEIKNWKRIYEQLESAAPSNENDEKKQEIAKKIALVEGVLDNEESEWS